MPYLEGALPANVLSEITKMYPCHLCEREFIHNEMWESKRSRFAYRSGNEVKEFLRKHATSHCFLSLPYHRQVKDSSGSKGTESTDGNARVPDEGAQGRIWDPAAALLI